METMGIKNQGTPKAQIKPVRFSTLVNHLFIRFITLLSVFLLSTSYISRKESVELANEGFQCRQIRQALSDLFVDFSVAEGFTRQLQQTVAGFYRARGYLPIWTTPEGPTIPAKKLVDLIGNAWLYGLYPSAYQYCEMQRLDIILTRSADIDERVAARTEFEIVLTAATLKLMVNLHSGIVHPDSAIAPLTGFAGKLGAYSADETIDSHILSVQPTSHLYISFIKALNRYLQPLVVSTEDGRRKYNLSDSTLAAFRSIALNLDRVRKQQLNGAEYVYVNIPAFKLNIVRDHTLHSSFRVVVGKPASPTPLLSSRIESVVVNPTWNVPRSITVNEILPLVKKDTSYLARNRFKILSRRLEDVCPTTINWSETGAETFDHYFVQASGHANALGRFKFNFRNPYQVYIHDTPAKQYFGRKIRAFSHGCVRIETPEKFAEFLIAYHMNHEKPTIRALLSSLETKEVILDQPLDVHFRYLTVEPDEAGTLCFYKDIYGKDEEELQIWLN